MSITSDGGYQCLLVVRSWMQKIVAERHCSHDVRTVGIMVNVNSPHVARINFTVSKSGPYSI